jgi:hypothetical protein
MALNFHSGFEFQSMTSGVEFATVTGSPTISTTTKYSGNAAMRCNPTAATAFVTTHEVVAPESTNNYFCSFRLYIATAPGANDLGIALGNDGSNNRISISLNSDRTILLFDDFNGTQIGSTSSALSLNTWYRIGIAWTRAGGGTGKGYIDGVQFATGALDVGFDGPNTWSLGAIQAMTADLYFDDFIVYDSSGTTNNTLPGDSRLVLALPTGAGDNAATAGIFSNINEIPPSDTATALGSNMIELDTTTSIGDYNVTNSATLGIGSGDTIKAVSVYAREREETSGVTNYTIRIKSAASGTTVSSSSVDGGNTVVRTNPNGTTAFGISLFRPTDPTTTVAWTPTGTNSIDNMQIGAATTDGNPDTWILWLAAYIEYVAVTVVESTTPPRRMLMGVGT